MTMWNGKKKALTFSYDDAVSQDIRLIEIFNRYGLKCTFNMNSELLGVNGTLIRDGVEVTHYKNKPEDIRYIYDGHEVAAHSLTHPFLSDLPDDEIIRQVEQDRLNLSELVGYEVCGFAYPCSSPKNDPRTIEIVRQKTDVRYARTVETTMSFAPQKDLYFVRGSIYHHAQWDKLFEMGERFLAAEEGEFYIWGHSYEFDIFPERWGIFEEFCKMMSSRPDIFYGTNKELFLSNDYQTMKYMNL